MTDTNRSVIHHRQGSIVYHKVSCNCIREVRDPPDGPMRMKLSCTPLYDSRVHRHLVWVHGGAPTLVEDYRYHMIQAPRDADDEYTIVDNHPLCHLFRPCGHCRPELGDLHVYGVMQC